MNKILILILFILMLLIGGKRGFKSFFSLFLNFIILIAIFYLMACGLNPILTSIVGCALISYIVIFMVNGNNLKSKVSLLAVTITLIIMAIIIFYINDTSLIGGFGPESNEDINMYSYDIALNMNNLAVALIILGLIGATIDTAVAISSSLYEIFENNRNLSFNELYKSGLNVGKDILCTTTNTLLFAFLGEFTTLVIWFSNCHYSFGDIINAKTFASEFLKLMCSGLGCVIIIPITTILMAYTITKKLHKNNDNVL